eukprot:TRINITY_DN9461_c0_g2_i1.p1 TRINITY_DN9461_c0_g2~~TRINITY_DN9461_c0_g2_i1.p1  ORF type:complete len:219 (+),score=16.37 TRINITY_DN9461_c0_g2_i1:208-864(+)
MKASISGSAIYGKWSISICCMITKFVLENSPCNHWHNSDSQEDAEFSYKFDTSELKPPAIFLFKNGRYEIYNGTRTAGSIAAFAKEYNRKLAKQIPPESDYFTWILSALKKKIIPLLILARYLGLGNFPNWLCIFVSLVILFLPLILLGFLCQSIDEEGEQQYAEISKQHKQSNPYKGPKETRSSRRKKEQSYSSVIPKSKTSVRRASQVYKRTTFLS